jgi:hypothetical protein
VMTHLQLSILLLTSAKYNSQFKRRFPCDKSTLSLFFCVAAPPSFSHQTPYLLKITFKHVVVTRLEISTAMKTTTFIIVISPVFTITLRTYRVTCLVCEFRYVIYVCL